MLQPSLEVGLRYDRGEAEAGAGLELGGGVRYSRPEIGLIMEANARVLVAHADNDYKERYVRVRTYVAKFPVLVAADRVLTECLLSSSITQVFDRRDRRVD